MKQSIFFYDGDCGFCNATVLFLLKNTTKKLLFCPLQSKYAENFFSEHGYRKPDLTTAYLFHHGRLYQKSAAILKSIALSKKPIKHLHILLVIPSFIRDSLYNFVSSVRQQIRLGKSSCRRLTPQERQRFLSL